MSKSKKMTWRELGTTFESFLKNKSEKLLGCEIGEGRSRALAAHLTRKRRVREVPKGERHVIVERGMAIGFKELVEDRDLSFKVKWEPHEKEQEPNAQNLIRMIVSIVK